MKTPRLSPEKEKSLWNEFRAGGRTAFEKLLQTHYRGLYHYGARFSKDVWHIIGPTEAGPQAGQTGGEMTAWTSRDEEKTWQKERQITTGSPHNHAYARRPLGAKNPFYAFWADGDPTRFSASHLYFGDSRGNCWALPYDMKEDFAVPKQLP